jgi:hypothetical protein
MSNHCWNYVNITGDPVTLAKLEVLFNTYADYAYLAEWANSFFPNLENLPGKENHEEYSTRWWEVECQLTSSNTLEISGDSAWSPPVNFIQMISEHYKVLCTLDFSESGNDFAGSYEYENGEKTKSYDCSYSQHVYDTNGITGLIDEYLYEEEHYKEYENASNFIVKMGIPNVTDEHLQKLTMHFEKNLKSKLNKKETLSDIADMLQHLKHLEMKGLALKVENIYNLLSEEWSDDLLITNDE